MFISETPFMNSQHKLKHFARKTKEHTRKPNKPFISCSFLHQANKKLKGVQLDQLFSILGIDSVRHVDDAVPEKVWEYRLVIPGCLVVLLVIATVVFIFQQRYILALVCIVVGAVVGIIVIRRVKKKTF